MNIAYGGAPASITFDLPEAAAIISSLAALGPSVSPSATSAMRKLAAALQSPVADPFAARQLSEGSACRSGFPFRDSRFAFCENGEQLHRGSTHAEVELTPRTRPKSSRRLCTPAFAKTDLKWSCTVFGVMTSRAAAAAVSTPSART